MNRLSGFPEHFRALLRIKIEKMAYFLFIQDRFIPNIQIFDSFYSKIENSSDK